ncbi:hypothetical protein GGF46_001548 [Coemansia sp. RSA 552]|nr:hypothetical protein GGF46_001548 [Coemansia sp. RSA 552]
MGQTKKGEKRAKSGGSSGYRSFFQRELKRIKLEDPSISHKDAFKKAGLNWRTSAENPKNGSGATKTSPDNEQRRPPAGPAKETPAVAADDTASALTPAAPAPLLPAGPAKETPADTAANGATPVAPAPPPAHTAAAAPQPAAPNPEEPAANEQTTAAPQAVNGAATACAAGGIAEKPADPARSEAPQAPAPSVREISSMAAHTVQGALAAAK